MGEELINEENSSCLRYVIPSYWSKDKKDAHPIFATTVIDAIIRGKNIEIINAVIKGDFNLKYVNVDCEIIIQQTELIGNVDWSYATFKRFVNFDNLVFETDAILKGATFEKDILLDNVTFCGLADFTNVRLMGNAKLRSVVFEKQASFNDAQVEGSAFFKFATFKGEADFSRARIVNGAEFCGSQFNEFANFISIRIMRYACFELTRFLKNVDFYDARIAGSIKFFGAEFKRAAFFDMVQIEENIFFNSVYLFCWDEIAENKYELLQFLNRISGIEWRNSTKIEKVDAGEMLRVFTQNNSLSLIFNDEKTRLILKIDENRNREFIVKIESRRTNIYSLPAIFRNDVNFERIQIKGDAEFQETTFMEKASFSRAHIIGNTYFSFVVFEKQASFIGAQIEGTAFFKPAIFKGQAFFSNARIVNGAEFCGSQFNEPAYFDSIQIIKYACFESTNFLEEVSFENARIEGSIKFFGAKFKKSNFKKSLIEGTAFFNPQYLFCWDEIPGNDNDRLIDLLKNTFGIVWAKAARIEKIDRGKTIRAYTEKNSVSLRLRLNDKKTKLTLMIDESKELIAKTDYRKTNIYISTTFEEDALFEDIQINGNAEFQETKFMQMALFNGAHIGETINFDGSNLKNIDLRGCIYNSISPLSFSFWKNVIVPYDRRHFKQIEEILRKEGRYNEADNVLYERKNQESREFKEINLAWFIDWVYKQLGYGVKLGKLFITILLFIVMGTIIFHLNGAVQPVAKGTPSPSWWEAFCICLEFFLSIEIPSAAAWTVSPNNSPIGIKFTTFATLLKLSGLIFGILIVAALAGLLKRWDLHLNGDK